MYIEKDSSLKMFGEKNFHFLNLPFHRFKKPFESVFLSHFTFWKIIQNFIPLPKNKFKNLAP